MEAVSLRLLDSSGPGLSRTGLLHTFCVFHEKPADWILSGFCWNAEQTQREEKFLEWCETCLSFSEKSEALGTENPRPWETETWTCRQRSGRKTPDPYQYWSGSILNEVMKGRCRGYRGLCGSSWTSSNPGADENSKVGQPSSAPP